MNFIIQRHKLRVLKINIIIMSEIEEIKQEIEQLKARNKSVELDKKWETSFFAPIPNCNFYLRFNWHLYVGNSH